MAISRAALLFAASLPLVSVAACSGGPPPGPLVMCDAQTAANRGVNAGRWGFGIIGAAAGGLIGGVVDGVVGARAPDVCYQDGFGVIRHQ